MKYHVEYDLDFKRNSFGGLFVAIEGLDGSGKTTQVGSLVKSLEGRHKVFETKNPTDGPVGLFIRDVLKGKIKVPATARQYLYSADRQTQQEAIIKHLKRGEIVISDRYFWSALAYGLVDWEEDNYELGAQRILVSQGILSMYDRHILPDLTLYLDVPLETAWGRVQRKDKKIRELYEHREKLIKVEDCYKWVLKRFHREITIIDGVPQAADVTDKLLGIISKAYGQKTP